jgi:hypothetical protein
VWGSVGWASSGGMGTGALIAQDAGVLVHVTATDLQNGTAHAGPVWTKVGTVPYNAGTGPRASVGPFSNSNYFTLAASNPLDISAGPITIVVICTIGSMSLQALITSDNTLAAGIGMLYRGDGSGQLQINNNSTSNFVQSLTFATPSSGLAVFFGGVDASGNLYAQVNNGSVGSAAGGALAVPTHPAEIGNNGGNFFTGNIYEVYATTDVPSNANFNTLYASIIANAQN